MRKPAVFITHPVSYQQARDEGFTRAVGQYIVDGDTFDVFLDLGFGQYAYLAIRLQGANTPELSTGEAGRAAKERTRALILDRPILIRAYRDRVTFDRYVADVYYFDAGGLRYSLAETLLSEGFAV